MVRVPGDQYSSLKKGTWTPDEDQKLVAYVERYRIWNWNHMAKFAGLSRSGKSCRLRWMNYLRPNIRRGNFSQAEEEIIMKMQQQLGNRWSMIASRLPGRTDNEIKNYWNTRFRNKTKHQSSSLEHETKAVKNLCEGYDDHHVMDNAMIFESTNSERSGFQGLRSPMPSLQMSAAGIDTELPDINGTDIGENKMEISEWFIELGSLWEEPLRIAAQGLCKVGDSEAAHTQEPLNSSALFDSIWQY